MTRPFLTVLTAPVLPPSTRAYRRLRAAVRRLVKPGVPLPSASPYPGHFALVRSVVEGLRANQADFNFNPRTCRHVGRAVYAPANEALRQAAAWKRDGTIDLLAAGPVNALFPDQVDGILQLPEIDILIIPSDWCRLFYADSPALQPKLRVCPAGVDAGYWTPSGAPRTNRAVVYWKSGSEEFCGEVEQAVREAGLTPLRIASKPGQHSGFTPGQFHQALDEAALAVYLSDFETQGLALAEAWSMDVPTVVWDPRGRSEWMGRAFVAGSSAPYLTGRTGLSWRAPAELAPALRRALDERAQFSPRAWVLAHMTDAICAQALERLLRDAEGQRR
ncbi:MAG: hypothetical protein A3J29_13460 [Acidobacteria bacterium RIFCSPLOWO2_12_FULL_67_14b]|nr:MAG: hypothetical protein A3J29_13460 [Acidobacteria bacterium RIFCSPLOWO2_12_FULL_67_14b]